MNNKARQLDLSNKFLHMSKALIEEGETTGDVISSQSGNILMLLSGLILSHNDMIIFSELCAMFTAKKILDIREKVDDGGIINVVNALKEIKDNLESSKVKKTRKSRKKDDDSNLPESN